MDASIPAVASKIDGWQTEAAMEQRLTTLASSDGAGETVTEKSFEKQLDQKVNPLKRVWKWFRTLLVPYVLVVILVMIGEPWLMFPGIARPGAEIDTSWPELETVSIPTTDDQTLQGLLFTPETSRGLVIICHGNGDLLCYMEDEVRVMSKRFDATVLAFDYRGYGNSDGFPSAKRLYEDGQAAYDYALQQGFKPEEIVVFGRSLGGAIAISIASENDVAGLGLQSTFSSITEVAASKFFWLPVRWLLRNRFPSAEKIARYDGPLVQCHGDADRIVPFRFGMKLHEAATLASPKVFVEEPGRGHNTPPTDNFWAEFGRMLDSVWED